MKQQIPITPVKTGIQHRNGTPASGGTTTLFVLFARIIVGGILLYAGFLKAVGPRAEFAAAIEAYKILPAPFISPLALALPYLEMWVGTYLISGFLIQITSVLAILLFTAFLGVLGSALARGIDLASCGCFGADTLSPRYSILLDIVLLALSVFLYKVSGSKHPYTLDAWLEK